jgi:predicted RNase H-like nuclease (RuvC/YqgF family)
MSKVEYYVKSFLALVKGDTVEATALKIKERSTNALKAQISNLEGDTMDYKEAVENAKEELEKATLNYGSESFDKTTYVAKLLTSKNALTVAEENLEQHLETIEFLKERLELINS